jgi:hypothetical protein
LRTIFWDLPLNNPPGLCLLSSEDYKSEPPHPAGRLKLLTAEAT